MITENVIYLKTGKVNIGGYILDGGIRRIGSQGQSFRPIGSGKEEDTLYEVLSIWDL